MTATDPDPRSGDMAAEHDSAESSSPEATDVPGDGTDNALDQVEAAGQSLETLSEGITESDLESVGAALDDIESNAPSENVADPIDSGQSADTDQPQINNVRELDTILAADIETALEDDGDPFGTTQEVETSTQADAISEPATDLDGSYAPQGTAADKSVSSPAESVPPVPPVPSVPLVPIPTNEPAPESSADASGIRTRAEAIARAALTRLSAPLKLIPESKRKYVDWIALSLALWVPIIWLIAFLTRG